MKELTDYLWPKIKLLLVPYVILMFLLVYRIDFQISAPGGITEVESLIQVDYEVNEIKGSISSTYVISFKRPTIFQFVISDFSPYNQVIILPDYYAHYTDQEIRDISYLQKMTSVDAAVIVAYQNASQVNSEIVFTDSDVYKQILVYGKAAELSNYDQIGLGDEFISMVGVSNNVISAEDIYDTGLENSLVTNMSDEDFHEFTFKGEVGEYQVSLTKTDIEENLSLNQYLLVSQSNIYPKFTEKDSNIGGPSGGLLQTLSIYNMLVEEDITKGLKIAGTGTIRYDGSVGYVGSIKQKIATAYLNDVDLFFIPAIDERYSSHNYLEALAACEEFGINPEGWLIPVASFSEAISYLEGIE
ncbi:MAG: hypothetical protein K9L64_03485 [Candidatus Izimaplasma sp.]|nr:hypothetical protein [Candidatus Izimaplasma bacterium]